MKINKLFKSVEVLQSSIDGKGLFAKSPLRGRGKIGELTGELISIREARTRAKQLNRIAIVELENGNAIDATKEKDGFRYINHSCSPNTFMRRFRNLVEFYAIKDIKPGEELTCDYGESHHEGRKRCTCGSPQCRGAI